MSLQVCKDIEEYLDKKRGLKIDWIGIMLQGSFRPPEGSKMVEESKAPGCRVHCLYFASASAFRAFRKFPWHADNL